MKCLTWLNGSFETCPTGTFKPGEVFIAQMDGVVDHSGELKVERLFVWHVGCWHRRFGPTTEEVAAATAAVEPPPKMDGAEIVNNSANYNPYNGEPNRDEPIRGRIEAKFEEGEEDVITPPSQARLVREAEAEEI